MFGCTEDATGANLPSQFSPWTAFKSIDLSRDGEPRAGVNANAVFTKTIEKHGFHITDAHVPHHRTVSSDPSLLHWLARSTSSSRPLYAPIGRLAFPGAWHDANLDPGSNSNRDTTGARLGLVCRTGLNHRPTAAAAIQRLRLRHMSRQSGVMQRDGK